MKQWCSLGLTTAQCLFVGVVSFVCFVIMLPAILGRIAGDSFKGEA